MIDYSNARLEKMNKVTIDFLLDLDDNFKEILEQLIAEKLKYSDFNEKAHCPIGYDCDDSMLCD